MASAGLVDLALSVNAPPRDAPSLFDSLHLGLLATPVVSPNGSLQLSYDGKTSLGPPGNTPTGIAYDNRTGDMFLIEDPSYLSVLAGSPPHLVDSIYLGPSSWVESVAVDSSNDTVFVGLYPSSVVVVSGSTHEIVAQLTLDVVPLYLAYDPATGDVYTGGGDEYLTAINGTTYTVSSLGPAGDSEFSPFAFTYDPGTGNLVMMGREDCLCGWQSGEVLAIDPATGNQTWTSSLVIYDDYSGMAVDSANGSIYLPTSFGGVELLNGTTGATLADFSMPGEAGCGLFGPAGMTYDPNSADVLVGECGGIVRPINTTSDTVGPPVSVGGMPSAIAVNTSTGNAYVLNWNTNSLAVLNPTASAVLSFLPVGGAPTAIAIDSATGTAYVASSDNVSVINLSGHRLIGSVSADIDSYDETSPEAIVLDPASDQVFVANSGNNTVGVISTLTNTLVATIPVASAPLALAWDYETNDIYAACQSLPDYESGNATLDVISVATAQVVANSSLGAITPDGIAYVEPLAELFVSNNAINDSLYSSPSLTIISTVTNQSVITIPLPANASTAGEVVYDNGTRDLYVAGAGMGYYTNNPDDLIVNPMTRSLVGNISVGTDPNAITPGPGSASLFAVAGVNDTVSLIDGATRAVTASAVLPFGAFPQALGYDPATGQVLAADWSNDSVSYVVPEEVYPVTVTETGLPAGANWSVTFNGTSRTSNSNTVDLTEPNGTLDYFVSNVTVNGTSYGPSPISGIIKVDGAASTVNVSFAVRTSTSPPPSFDISVVESGLPSRTDWGAKLAGTMTSSTTSSIVFSEPNGSYLLVVEPPANYTANFSSPVVVDGMAVTVGVVFLASTYPAVFLETGLPTGSGWSVTVTNTASLDTTSGDSTGPTVSLPLANGTYSIMAAGPTGYRVSLSAPEFSVHGPDTPSILVTFTSVAPSGLTPAWLPWLTVGVLVIVGLFAIVGAGWGIRRYRYMQQREEAQRWFREFHKGSPRGADDDGIPK
jgi:YVTN family beta-propeller protein